MVQNIFFLLHLCNPQVTPKWEEENRLQNESHSLWWDKPRSKLKKLRKELTACFLKANLTVLQFCRNSGPDMLILQLMHPNFILNSVAFIITISSWSLIGHETWRCLHCLGEVLTIELWMISLALHLILSLQGMLPVVIWHGFFGVKNS